MKKTDVKLRQIVCNNLRLFRKENGYTQEEVAKALGMVRSTYTYYETGKTYPDIYAIYRLAKLYRIDYGLFFVEGLEKPSITKRKEKSKEP